MSHADFIRLQSTIGGLAADSGRVFTLLGELDHASGVLLIDAAKQVPAGSAEKRWEGCAAVTNNEDSQARDMLFTEADLRDALASYFEFAGRGLLVLDEAVGNFNPHSNIEADGLDDRGRKYRISPAMTNGQLSVIVMCWFALRQRQSAGQIEAFDDLDLYDITSVGIDDGGMNIRVGRDGWPA